MKIYEKFAILMCMIEEKKYALPSVVCNAAATCIQVGILTGGSPAAQLPPTNRSLTLKGNSNSV